MKSVLETAFTKALNEVPLHGHQNVGELRLLEAVEVVVVNDCMVTRMLVSYDLKQEPACTTLSIAVSPECW